MIFAALTAINDRLKADAGIAAFFTLHYPAATPHFFIGAKLKPTAQEFPYLAIAPMQEKRPRKIQLDRTLKISLMMGVTEPGIVEGVNIGLERLAALGELVYAALDPQPLCKAPLIHWGSDAEMISDAGVQHPHYEGEIIFEVSIYTT